MVFGRWRKAFQQGRIRTTNRSFQRTSFAMQATNFCCAVLDLSTKKKHITEQPQGFHEVDLIRDVAPTFCPKLLDKVSGHHFRDFLAPVGQVALKLDEDLSRIAHPKHDARSRQTREGHHSSPGSRRPTAKRPKAASSPMEAMPMTAGVRPSSRRGSIGPSWSGPTATKSKLVH